MAALYWCPCVVYGSTRFYLPPGATAQIGQRQAISLVPVAQTNAAVITDVRANQGTRVTLGLEDGSSTATQAYVLKWYQDLWTTLKGRTFDLYLFSDRRLRNCAMESLDTRVGMEPLIYLRDVGLGIVSESDGWDTGAALTFANYDNDYPYASLVGRPVGTAVTPGADVAEEPSMQTFGGLFPGQVFEATASGQEHRYIVGGSSGSQWTVKGLQITGAELVGTGTTTVHLGTAAIGGVGGSSVEASIGAAARVSDVASAGFTVTAGDSLYVWVEAAGGHQNVQYHFDLAAD